MIKTILLVILLFVLMIFPHELGHFLAAKAAGVGVNEFSFGMGPKIFSKKKNGTVYSIRLFPIGGFTALEGEDGAEGETLSEHAFSVQPAHSKIFILAAGAAMNVIVCFVVLTILAMAYGMPTTVLASVQKGSPAQEAGLQAGDRIVSINGTEISSWSDVSGQITEGTPESVTVERNGKELTVTVTPEKNGDRYQIGVTSKLTRSPAKALLSGLKGTGSLAVVVIKSVRMLVTGEAGLSDLSGPVGIVSVVHQTASYNLYYFFVLLALISVNLAILNLLPLPALDGGRILFILVRKISGGRISDEQEGMVHFIGFVALMVLAVIVTFSDVGKLIG